MSRPSLVVVALALVVAADAPRAAAQSRVLPPGLEEEIATMVLPGSDPAELAGDVRVDAVRIEPTHVDVVLAGADHRGVARLLPRGEISSGWPAGETASFAVALVEGADDPALREAASALRARIAARDAGRFFEEHATVAPDAGSGTVGDGAARWWMRAAASIPLLLALVVSWVARRRGGGRLSRSSMAVAIGLSALSVVLWIAIGA